MIIGVLVFILVTFSAILLISYFLWILIPGLSGLPWIPTQPLRIRRALSLAGLRPEEIIYDLGSGDGRTLIMASHEFGAHAIGVEISPIHCIFTLISILFHGVRDKAEIKWANYYHVDFSNADVIFAYMTSKEISRLRSRLEDQLKPGARVVTVSCEISGWQPVIFDHENLLYLYTITAPKK